MNITSSRSRGSMSIVLILIIVAALGGVGGYVSKQNTNEDISWATIEKGGEIFPDVVASIPIRRQSDGTVRVEVYKNRCESTPVKFCGDFETRRYIPSNASAPWAFRVEI